MNIIPEYDSPTGEITLTRKELINELEEIFGPASLDPGEEPGGYHLVLNENGNVPDCSRSASDQIKAYVLDTYGSLEARLRSDADSAIIPLLEEEAIRYDSQTHRFVVTESRLEFATRLRQLRSAATRSLPQ
jgi:hypothetical protein